MGEVNSSINIKKVRSALEAAINFVTVLDLRINTVKLKGKFSGYL